jgi:hypothetical protein
MVVARAAKSDRGVRLVLFVAGDAAVTLEVATPPRALGDGLKATNFVGHLARSEPWLEEKLVSSSEHFRNFLLYKTVEILGLCVRAPCFDFIRAEYFNSDRARAFISSFHLVPPAIADGLSTFALVNVLG